MKFNDKGIRMRKAPAIVALGVAGFCGVAACTAAAPAPPPATSRPAPPTTSHPAPPPARTDTALQPVAQDVADIAVGNGVLTALSGGDGEATSANCDPGTVSNLPDVSIPASASCGITYPDGSTRQQTVTISFDVQGNPVAGSADVGTELSQLTGG